MRAYQSHNVESSSGAWFSTCFLYRHGVVRAVKIRVLSTHHTWQELTNALSHKKLILSKLSSVAVFKHALISSPWPSVRPQDDRLLWQAAKKAHGGQAEVKSRESPSLFYPESWERLFPHSLVLCIHTPGRSFRVCQQSTYLLRCEDYGMISVHFVHPSLAQMWTRRI